MGAPVSAEQIGRLAKLRGIGEAYHDYRGELRVFSLQTQREVLRAMGCDVDDPAAVDAAIAEAVALATSQALSQPQTATPPLRCFEPPTMAAGQRIWGIAVQLYTLRSQHNWGIGDFADLALLLRAAAARGAGFVGVNPLHALFLSRPQEASPYGASSRHFLNVLYIAVQAVDEFRTDEAVQREVASAAFAERLQRVRAAAQVDYVGVAALKLPVLEQLYRRFRERHLAPHLPRTPRAQAFLDFVARGGRALRLHALFEALDLVLAQPDAGPGWLSWPAEYRDPESIAVQAFAAAHEERIGFQLYLQWLAHEQLAAAQAAARDLGMTIGLYGDYAVGANAAGSETWSDQQTYRLGAGIGAPPDPLALKGQDWGIPPQDPQALRAQQLAPFIDLVARNCELYGALRLDHIMALFRQWWVPRGLESTQGGYVHYPVQEMLAALAVQSQRHQCLIVGEDLGTVPDEMRVAMPQYGVYHYKVMLFEKEHGGQLIAPGHYVRHALATVSTHDLPPLRSWWEGGDIDLRARLGLYPDDGIMQAVRDERQRDREALLRALWIEGLAPASPATADEPFTLALAQAMHAFVARSRAAMVALQIEDLIGMSAPVNIPGTSHEYPNWSRKVSLSLEEIFARDEVGEMLAAVESERRG